MFSYGDQGGDKGEGKTASEGEKDTSNEEVSHIEVLRRRLISYIKVLLRRLIANQKGDLKVIRDLAKSLDGPRYDCDNSGTAFESDTNKTRNSSDKARQYIEVLCERMTKHHRG